VRVPNADFAVVEERKVKDYPLSSSHPVGRYKARFFGNLGYDLDGWRRLASDRRAILANEVSESVEIDYGTKYVVPGQLMGAGGTTTCILTAWVIPTDENVPRLVTAYPGERDEN
jgi:hypothetical protein